MAQGSGELSARGLAAIAGANASAIYYYFDDLEHLYEATQRVAIAEASDWIAARRDALLSGLTASNLPPAALGSLLAQLIDAWCEEARPLAFAWRECQLLAARNPRFAPLRAEWAKLWREFFDALCPRLGAAAAAEATWLFFDGESLLHLMRWNRTIDRAALDESCMNWGRWIGGMLPCETPWRLHARERARGTLSSVSIPDGNGAAVAEGAAALLATRGLGAVTHRAVATQAGLTLGAVSHVCKRTDDLLRLAYARIYLQLTGGRPDRLDAKTPVTPPPADATPAEARLLAIDELILAVARGRAEPGLIGMLRYLRGTTSIHTVRERIACSETQSIALAAILSSIGMGFWRTSPAHDDVAAYDAFLDRLFAPLIAA
jgi:AcrR family transcriptional regulator